MAVFFDRAAMTVSGTPGTGPITLASAYYKHQTFAAAGVTNGVQVAYSIEDGANWETGLGTYSSAGPTLTRTTIRYSSNANTAINVSSSAVVYSTFTAEDIPGGGTLAVSAGGSGATSLTGVLKGNGVSAVTTAVQGTDYSLITTGTSVASTSGTSIDFTGIPAGVKRITVMLNGVSTNGSSLLLAQIGSGSVSTSGYLGNSGGASSTGNSVGAITAGIGLEAGTVSAASIRYLILTLTNITGNSWVGSSVGAISQTTQYNVWACGSITLGGALDRVRITATNGTDTFDAGTINIMYEY